MQYPFQSYYTDFKIHLFPHFTSSEIWMHLTIDGMSCVIGSISSPLTAGKIMVRFIINDILIL